MVKMFRPLRTLFPLRNNAFFGPVLTLASGTAAAQAIPLLASPILARTYDAAEFGAFGIFFSVSLLITSVATGKYELAILLPENGSDAKILAIVSMGLASAVAILLLALSVIALASNSLRTFAGWGSLLALSVIGSSATQILTYLLTRYRKFSVLSVQRTIQAISIATMQCILAQKAWTMNGLIIGSLIGQFISLFTVGGMIAHIFHKTPDRSIRNRLLDASFTSMIATARKYGRFPAFSAPTALVNSGSVNLPVLLVGKYWGDEIAGYLVLTQRVITAPLTIVGNAIGQVFVSDISRTSIASEVAQKTRTLLQTLVPIGLIPSLVLAGFGDILFAAVFGAHWKTAGEFSRALSLVSLLAFVGSPLSGLFVTAGRQKQELYFHLTLLMSRAFALAIAAALQLSPLATVALFSVSGALVWASICCYLLRLSSCGPSDVGWRTARIIILAFAVALAIRGACN